MVENISVYLVPLNSDARDFIYRNIAYVATVNRDRQHKYGSFIVYSWRFPYIVNQLEHNHFVSSKDFKVE